MEPAAGVEGEVVEPAAAEVAWTWEKPVAVDFGAVVVPVEEDLVVGAVVADPDRTLPVSAACPHGVEAVVVVAGVLVHNGPGSRRVPFVGRDDLSKWLCGVPSSVPGVPAFPGVPFFVAGNCWWVLRRWRFHRHRDLPSLVGRS